MTPPNPNQFEPPTVDRLTQHLADHGATDPSPWRGGMPLLLGGVVVMALMMMVHPLLAVLPWIGLMAAMAWMAARVQRARTLHQQVTRAWELAMLRHHREALRRAWNLLPLVRRQPELHGRCVAVMAHVLDDLACYDAAMVAMDHLLDRLPEGHPLAMMLRVQRANCALCTDQLADADDALRKLRAATDTLPPGPIPAGYHLARLVQDVRTGHYAEAAQHADDTAQQLRPLGVHAGYGYGLLAYCQHQLALRNDDPQHADQQRSAAQQLWHRATLLIPPAALAFRYRELGTLPTAAPAPTADTGADA